MLARAISQTVHSKLDHMAPRATRPRRQHVEVAAQRHDDDFPSQRGLEGARQPSPQRRSADKRWRRACSSASILNCLMPAEGARAHDEAARVKSERDEWGDVVEGLAPRTERRPFCERRALAPPDDHHAVGSCADWLSALREGTCHAPALHAIRAGP